MQSESSRRSMQIEISVKQGCNMNTYEHENLNSHKILYQSDLEAVQGRKLSRQTEIDRQTTSKSWKFQKIRKSRKTAENFRIERFSDLKYSFSLC